MTIDLGRWIRSSAFIAVAVAGNAACQQPTATRYHIPIDTYGDSLTRAVPVDSLRKPYTAMLNADDPKAIAPELGCEQSRLSYQYGIFILYEADRRLRDSLWRQAGPRAVERMDEKLAGAIGGSNLAACNIPHDRPKAPDSLNWYPPFKRRSP